MSSVPTLKGRFTVASVRNGDLDKCWDKVPRIPTQQIGDTAQDVFGVDRALQDEQLFGQGGNSQIFVE